jgi:DNA-binding PadR family transcriptional regulator
MSFTDDVSNAAEYAKREAEKVPDGRTRKMVSASVDGRSEFAQSMKRYGERTRDGWSLEQVKMNDSYGIILSVIEENDFGSHKKRIRAYRAFREKIEQQGVKCPLEISTHSY